MRLREYVRENAERGACQCGKCFDAPENPEEKQPNGHTADLVFFKVALSEKADKNTFLELVKEQYPQWLDGEEHNYMKIGGEMGDQGLALMTMGMGELLGVWELITPKILGLPDELVKMMAGQGFVIIQARPKTEEQHELD